MFRLKLIHLASLLVLWSPRLFGQWSPVDSGTTSNLNGAVLLDSGTGFVAGDTGTILKSTDTGATWTPLTSGTSNTLHGVYSLIPMKESLSATAAQFFAQLTEGLPGKALPAA